VVGYRWRVKEGLTITREMSVEEKLDALRESLDKLEKKKPID
jgi:hypothetical protein